MDIVEAFVDQIIRDRNFQSEDEEFKKQVKADLMDRAQRRLNAALIENMPPAQMGDFEALLARSAPDAEVMAFCKQHIPDLEAVMATALLDLRTTYLAGSQEM